MAKRTIIPYGPQHPVLPEPVHLDLVLQDETVLEAIPSIGFIHRGLEKLVEKKDFNEYVFVAERICGICSFLHGMGYCYAIENIMNVEVPEKANFLRTFWGELSRVHSNLLWMGLLADGFGFESLFMHTWRIREKILDIFDMTTGGRVIFSVCKVGGVRRDIDSDTLKKAREILCEVEEELNLITPVYTDDSTVRHRLEGLGFMSKQDAVSLGAVGPTARASGVATDMRKIGYAAYKHVNFEVVTEEAGDCMARVKVRMREVYQAIDIAKQCIDMMPKEQTILTKVKGNPKGEFMARIEQPRGQVIYYAKANGTKYLDRMRIRTPTFANIPPMLHMLKGTQLSDVAMIILTIDPCISCAER